LKRKRRVKSRSSVLVEPAARRSPPRHRQSPFLPTRRARRDSSSQAARRPKFTFSSAGPEWRPTGSVKRSKFIGSNDPPSETRPPRPERTWNPAGSVNKTKPIRAFDPVRKPSLVKSQENLWKPSSKTASEKVPRYFEPTLKPELTAPLPLAPRKTMKNTKRVPSADPKIKTRIAQAESKVKSAWQPSANDPKPPVARPTQRPATTIPAKPLVKPVPRPPRAPVKKPVVTAPAIADTGRSSLNDVPTKPMFQSTPVNQSVVGDETDDLFENESDISVQPTKPPVPSTPPPRTKVPTPPPGRVIRRLRLIVRLLLFSLSLVAKPDPQTKSEIKNGVLIQGNDAEKIRDDHPSSIECLTR
jgi:hypothetical protein